MTEQVATTRTRDPTRKQRILAAAADLLAHNGYHSVSMADIGASAGITGSGIYRHFESKSAVLVALFDRVIDALLEDAHQIVRETTDLNQALQRLIASQVEFVINDHELAQVYHNEIQNLPNDDRSRLRRKQRMYVEEWVHILDELRPELSDGESRALVHMSIGAIQSPLFYRSGLAQERLRELLTGSAHTLLDH